MAYSNPYSPVLTHVSLPFSGVIPGGLTSGKQIHLQGTVQNVSMANGFGINLCYGPTLEPNCAMHFNVRFNEGCIVRNHMYAGTWGPEERSGGLPITKGHLFEIIILADTSGYKVAVNGRHFTEFKHRIPMEQVQYLHIAGNCMSINFIKFEGGNVPISSPSPPGFSQPMAYPVSSSGPLYSPAVPLTELIPGGMFSGRMISISGIARHGAKRFTINLQSGTSEHADINLHFDVRINMNSGNKQVVVRNHRSAGVWGTEERAISHFPFMPNGPFELMFLAEPYCFKVAVNNMHYLEFAHRLPLQNASTLNISGDVQINLIRFQ